MNIAWWKTPIRSVYIARTARESPLTVPTEVIQIVPSPSTVVEVKNVPAPSPTGLFCVPRLPTWSTSMSRKA